MQILGLFVRHRTAANLLMALMLVAGLIAAFNIRAQYFPDVVVNAVSVSVAWDGAGAEDADELCVIGGGEIYALMLPLAEQLHLTEVDTVVAGADAFFPEIDYRDWRLVERRECAADERHPFAFRFLDLHRRLD